MLNILSDYSLRQNNSFGVEVKAASYLPLHSMKEIHKSIGLLKLNHRDFLILGEGSNILFTSDYPGLILHPVLKGIESIGEDPDHPVIKVACGENWDQLVNYTVNKGWSGIENLSLIPGSVGSAPVQNIGAYGAEARDTVLWVEGIDIATNSLKRIVSEDCQFGYRNSIFKEELKNKFIITHVAFSLLKKPNFNLSYANLDQLFREKEKKDLKSLREIIINIREKKLPDPKITGNAGSFFKNPLINLEHFTRLREKFPEIPFYPTGDLIKIPAAWLIEKSGWKGKRAGNVGTWPHQPLVIVNYGGASGKEILDFSLGIQESVIKIFNIELEREVSVIF